MEQTHPSAPSRVYVLCAIAAALFLALGPGSARAAQFTLSWADNSSNEAGFRIERSTNGGAFEMIATVGANVVSYVDAGLQNATTYAYRVCAYNAAGTSRYSNEVSATTPPLLSNAPPTVSNIANRALYASGSTVVPFLIHDAETAAGALVVSAESSNSQLLPRSALALSGSGSVRSLTVTPVSGLTGSATVTVSVSDGVNVVSDTFVVTVNPLSTVGPAILAQPVAQSITPGRPFTLSVSVEPRVGTTYQWYFKDTPIAGATSASYTIPLAQRRDAGWYHVVIVTGGVSITSNTVLVDAVPVPNSGRLINLSTRALVRPGDGLLVPGLVINGSGSKKLLVRMVGPGLEAFGLPGLLPDPGLLLKQSIETGHVDRASNNNWSDGGRAQELTQVFAEVGAFELPASSNDAAMLLDLTAGVYSFIGANEQDGVAGLAMVEIYDTGRGSGDAAVVNMSTRGHLGIGHEVMITGFVIEGGPMTLLLRAVGPGLAGFGVAGLVADPRMDLVRRVDGVDEVIASNDNWESDDQGGTTAAIGEQVSAFALERGSRDAAMVVTLPAGLYTLVAQGSGTSTGVALVEAYVVP